MFFANHDELWISPCGLWSISSQNGNLPLAWTHEPDPPARAASQAPMTHIAASRRHRIGTALLDLVTPLGTLGRKGFWARVALSFVLVTLPVLGVAIWRLWAYLAESGLLRGSELFFTFEARLVVTYCWRGFFNAWALLAVPVLMPGAIRRLRDVGLPGGLALLTFGAMLVAWWPVPRSEFLITLQVPTITLALLVPVLGVLPPARTRQGAAA